MKCNLNSKQHSIVVIVSLILVFSIGFCMGRYCFGGNDYFKNDKVERDNATQKSLDSLKALVDNQSTPQEQKDKASEDYRQLSLKFEKEATLESKVKALGFKKAMCYLEDDRVKVVVQNKDKLKDEESKKIKDAILQESNIKDVEIIVRK
ncbi:SpoIIIAH-like protein [Clostridium collagenovorans DSM 3089]|uniref:SpoIIIAH-like protein n=1 Tax=Clostridium collagenovorans DSM 3089 TaxID=1121306 RepID=A0A1M5YNJ7_9CLOT|nr:SpoIIIAH-like family protein [Clostridium collagenovorans]SHI13677.1 SpoIIIAH-like protein [Clostridium collagenovorans DSM 3089]